MNKLSCQLTFSISICPTGNDANCLRYDAPNLAFPAPCAPALVPATS